LRCENGYAIVKPPKLPDIAVTQAVADIRINRVSFALIIPHVGLENAASDGAAIICQKIGEAL
jgi:hypothetical protein